MTEAPMLVDWKGLKKWGWPKSRTQTYRDIANGKFPQPKKFGTHRGSRVAWRVKDVKPFFE